MSERDAGEPWWKAAVAYQIYPRSFCDSDGDGVGDLEGIRRRLDHLAWLGVDALWISPCFPSPMADFGYDVADYCDIDPRFGTLADFDRLLAACHARGIRVILDWVPAHTSERHPWFVESRASRGSAKRDWYFWRDPAPGGGPPNNWLSAFGGSAWEWDAATDQYYLHSHLVQQPDLNWRELAMVAPIAAAIMWMGVYPESFLAPMRKDIAALDARVARARPEGDARLTLGKPKPVIHHEAATAHEGAH